MILNFPLGEEKAVSLKKGWNRANRALLEKKCLFLSCERRDESRERAGAGDRVPQYDFMDKMEGGFYE